MLRQAMMMTTTKIWAGEQKDSWQQRRRKESTTEEINSPLERGKPSFNGVSDGGLVTLELLECSNLMNQLLSELTL